MLFCLVIASQHAYFYSTSFSTATSGPLNKRNSYTPRYVKFQLVLFVILAFVICNGSYWRVSVYGGVSFRNDLFWGLNCVKTLPNVVLRKLLLHLRHGMVSLVYVNGSGVTCVDCNMCRLRLLKIVLTNIRYYL